MTKTELKDALKRKQAYVLVSGTETFVEITHREAEKLRKALNGAVRVRSYNDRYAAEVYATRPSR